MTQLSSKVVMAMILLAGLAAAQATTSTAPAVGKVVMHTTNPHTVHLTVSWPNSWRNERNHDAAWLTLRGPDASKGPVRLAKDGHTANMQGGGAAMVQVAADGTGVFVAPAFQAMCLPLLEKAVAAGEASGTGFAYLTDRVRVKQKRPQLYGTQYHAAKGEDGKFLQNEDGSMVYLAPIVEDPDNLGARRKKAGLGPWADYEVQMASLQKRKVEKAPRRWNGKLPVNPERR